LDLPSAALSLVAVLAVIYGLKRFAEDGQGWLPALAVAVGLIVGAAFVRRQRRLADPLIDLRLFRLPAFSAALAAYTLVAFVTFGLFLSIYQYLQLVHGLSPLAAGLWAIPSSGGFIVGSMLAPLLVRRWRPASVMAAGLVVAAGGFAALTQIDGDSLALVVTGSVIFSIGLAPVFTLTTDLIVGAAPPERAGAASAISETGAEFGGALGIAILGSISTAVYRHELTASVPAGVPAAEAGAARETLGGAVAAADRLADPLGAALLEAAREAFLQGFQLTAAVGAVGALMTAVLVAIMVRRVGADPAQEGRLLPKVGSEGDLSAELSCAAAD
jgi:DHA2 family multidrug resistance protein-like MFS transporter